MSLLDPANQPKRMTIQDWVDAFFVACEVAVEEMSFSEQMAEKLGQNVRYMPKVSMEDYHNRRTIWKRIKDKLGTFGTGAYPEDLGFHGLKRAVNAETYEATGNEVKFYLGNDPVPVKFMGEEIPVVINFISFYRALCFKLDPQAFVKESLLAEGINESNYATHPKSPAGLIANPFQKDDTP